MTQSSKDVEAIQKVLRDEKLREFDVTRKILDTLRKTRSSRGGTGAPLEIPKHLRQPIIFTDADEKGTQ